MQSLNIIHSSLNRNAYRSQKHNAYGKLWSSCQSKNRIGFTNTQPIFAINFNYFFLS